MMKIISTNIAEPVTFMWEGEEVTTGIFKKPVQKPLFITRDDIETDEISDRLHHGGYYKACYVFSADQYPYWKELYAHLDWDWGMFGENLTVANLNEKEINVGDIYKVGTALLQVSQYREPCYKLNYRFGSKIMAKQFVEQGFAGTYFSVLEEGEVKVGDEFVLIEKAKNSLTVAELFGLRHYKEKDPKKIQIAANSKYIAKNERDILKGFLEL